MEISAPHNRAWSHDVVVADPSPEIPGDEDFGKRVAAARDAKGMTQRELAGRVKITQPAISDIEAGGSSAYIPDICRVLNIPGPMFGWSKQQREWAILGHELERRSPANFKFTLNNLKQLLTELPTPPPDDDEPPPPPKKPRVVGSAHIVGLDRPARGSHRNADETPGESKKKP